MKKVLHILNTGSCSGAEKVAILIIRGTEQYGEAAYLCLKGPIKEKLNDYNIKNYQVDKLTMKAIRKSVKEYKPDIIHAHDFTASVVCAFSLVNKPIVSHLHHNSPWISRINWRTIIYLLSSIRFKKILTVSDSILSEFCFGGLIESKSCCVSNPINNNYVIELAKDKCNTYSDIVFLGRLTAAKDPIRFLRIISRIVATDKLIKASVIGDGELREECEDFILKNGLTQNVNLCGYLDNPFPILKNSKVLCITSKWEGYGLVASEALSLGIPVVSTSVGGLKEIVNDKCGLLVNEDDILIGEVVRLLNDTSYYSKKSNNAIKRSKILDNMDHFMEKMISIYKDIY